MGMIDYEKHIDGLIDLSDDIPQGKITMLTGSNGSGKSLVRKLVSQRLGGIAHVSMELRTRSNPEWGALSSMMHDNDVTPTSLNTFDLITQMVSKVDDKFLVIDEPEIGMGEETVMALVSFLNEVLPEALERNKGILVITHNRYIVENLNYDEFRNTDGLETKGEWLNRELVPTDLDRLKDNELFRAIRDRMNANKEKKQA